MTESEVYLAVIMERKTLVNKWADFQWEAIGVVPAAEEGGEPRRIFADGTRAQWLFPPLRLKFDTEEAENYLGNIAAPQPRVFVMWRKEGELPQPALLTVSYGEAARMMDSGEQVDGVPMPLDIREWLTDFVARHYRPPEKKKGRRFATQGDPQDPER